MVSGRTLILIFCLTLTIISRIPLSLSQSTEILVAPNSTLTSVFNNFIDDINLVDFPEFFSFGVHLAYDPSLLNISSVSINIPWTNVGYVINEQEGTIWISGFNFELGLSGNLSLATITFYAEKMGNSTLHFYNTKFYDANLLEIPYTSSDGNVEILGTITLNAETNEQAYYLLQCMSIYGNVFMESIPIYSSLLAIQIDTPRISPPLRVFRTTTTGQPPAQLPAEILSVTPCDSEANPKSSFNAGTYAYFNVAIRNNLDISINVLKTVTLFDDNGAPFGFALFMGPVAGGAVSEWKAEINLPPDTSAGKATAYACLFSDFPMLNGTAYCPEKSANFQIMSYKYFYLPPVTQGQASPGSFNLTFRLGLSGGIGTYNVYVTAVYKIQSDMVQMNFSASLLGNLNGDREVGPDDFFLFARAYGTELGDKTGAYLPEADFDKDGTIGPADFNIFGRNYGLSV